MNKISEYLIDHDLPQAGYVLMERSTGEPFAWTEDIQELDPSKVQPGTIACDIAKPENIWEAHGGSDERGALTWSNWAQN